MNKYEIHDTGRSVTVSGRTYPLWKMADNANQLIEIPVSEVGVESPLGRALRDPTFFLEDALWRTKGDPGISRIVEINHKTLKIEGRVEHLSLGLKAQDVHLVGLQCVDLQLTGSVINVTLSDSPNVKSILLNNGVFREVDLSQLALEAVFINLDAVEVGKIKLPRNIPTVYVLYGNLCFEGFTKLNHTWRYEMSDYDIGLALDGWNDPAMRGNVVGQLLTLMPKMRKQKIRAMLASRSMAVFSIVGVRSTGALAMVGILLAETNWYKGRPRPSAFIETMGA